MKNHKLNPLERWNKIRKLKRDALRCERYLDFVSKSVNEGYQKESEDYSEYANSKDEIDEAYNLIFYLNSCEMTNLGNFVGFVSFAEMDLATIHAYLLNANSDVDRKFFIRLLCMNMYEFSDDFLNLLGNDRNKDIVLDITPVVEAIGDDSLTKECNSLRSKWAKFRKKISEEPNSYITIRSSTVAHKDHNFLKQYESLKSINEIQIMEDFDTFNKIFNDTNIFLTHLMPKIRSSFKEKCDKLGGNIKREIDTIAGLQNS